MKFDEKAFLKELTEQPGVYRMFDGAGRALYIGKAKNLKNRLRTYFQNTPQTAKLAQMRKQIANIDVTIVRSEAEALLLEQNYIQALRPKYNVLLQDDKSYPSLLLSTELYPSLTFHRGIRRQAGDYFGPLANSGAAKAMLSFLKPLFKVRQCPEHTFKHRSKPCLQHDLGNCTAPCVPGYVSVEDYQRQSQALRTFLLGDTQSVLTQLVARMNAASLACRYEEATGLRDQIKSIRALTAPQSVQGGSLCSADILSAVVDEETAFVNQLMVRHGEVLGSYTHALKAPVSCSPAEALTEFIGQFYLVADATGTQGLNRLLPDEVITSCRLPSGPTLQTVLSELKNRPVRLRYCATGSGEVGKLLQLSVVNAQHALALSRQQLQRTRSRLHSLEAWLGRSAPIRRIECFDISHTQGTFPVGACVVYAASGPLRSEYRSYSLRGLTPGDDYAAIAQSVRRRYKPPIDPASIPDVILIDGGKGQLQQATQALAESWNPELAPLPILIAVAKGPSRRPGVEKLFLTAKGSPVLLSHDSALLHLIQEVRDEAHRYAVTRHRKQRRRGATRSVLDDIPGIGAVRRQRLLGYIGGMRALKGASIREISGVPGISAALASAVFSALHPDARSGEVAQPGEPH